MGPLPVTSCGCEIAACTGGEPPVVLELYPSILALHDPSVHSTFHLLAILDGKLLRWSGSNWHLVSVETPESKKARIEFLKREWRTHFRAKAILEMDSTDDDS